VVQCVMYIPYDFCLHLDLISSRCELQSVEHLAVTVVSLGDGDDNGCPGTATKTALVGGRVGETRG
jgi:hypothetical protein